MKATPFLSRMLGLIMGNKFRIAFFLLLTCTRFGEPIGKIATPRKAEQRLILACLPLAF